MAAWVLLGFRARPHGCRMDRLESVFPQVGLHCQPDGKSCVRAVVVRGGTVSDVLYIGLTIVVFAALWLLVKGVERVDRG